MIILLYAFSISIDCSFTIFLFASCSLRIVNRIYSRKRVTSTRLIIDKPAITSKGAMNECVSYIVNAFTTGQLRRCPVLDD